MKQLIIISIMLGGFLHCNAQSNKIKKAEKLMDLAAYAEALEYYDSIIEQGVDSAHIAKNVAHAYYKLRDPKNGEEWYAVVVKNDPEPQDYLKYAEMLKSNGKYNEAQGFMGKYNDLHSNDTRAEQHLENTDYYVELSEESRRFKVMNEYSDSIISNFSPNYYGDRLVFCSDMKIETGAIKRENKTTNKPFVNLFQAQLDHEGNLSHIQPLDENLMSSFHEGPVTFNKALDQIYFTRSNVIDNKKRKASDNQIKLQIFHSQRTDNGWSEPTEFAHNNTEYSVGHPALSPDGNTLYFVSDMKGGHGGTDIWMCQLDGEQWSKPENLGSRFNTSGNEMFPYIHRDGTLYFSSDGLLGLGGLDVFECRPAQYGFKSPRNIQAPINTNKDDFGFTLNKSKTAGYLSSNRKIGQQTDDLFYFSRQEVLPLLLSGKLSNELVNEVNLAESKIRIIDNEGSIIKTKHLNDDGTFDFEIDPTHTDFKIQTNDGTGWINHSMNDRLTSITEEEKYLGELDFGNVLIESNPFYFDEILLDDDSSILLKGYEVNLTNTTTGEKTKVPVGSDGSITFELDPNSKYEIEYSKKGWLSELRTFNSEDLVKSKDSFKKKLAFSPEKIEIGKTLAIKNINYDFNKSEIRRDAQIILDQLVNFMNKNPTVEIEISSHTDARGSAAYNMRLSQKRAKSALNYLTKMGISKKRLKWKGYGKSMLKNKCKKKNDCNDEFHEVNRRTEFIITAFQ